nr:hypothetical protein [Candidatus Liberibacter africanus]
MSLSLRHILHSYIGECNPIIQNTGSAFLPSNIALCKYWGKRDSKLNLPFNNSLSLSLGCLGTTTHITVIDSDADCIILNGQKISPQSSFFNRITQFCDLFRQFKESYFLIETSNNIPTKAGLASSASGFAALTLALFRIYSIPEKMNLYLVLHVSVQGVLVARFIEDFANGYAEQIKMAWIVLLYH